MVNEISQNNTGQKLGTKVVSPNNLKTQKHMAKQLLDKATGFVRLNVKILMILLSDIMENPENREGLGIDEEHKEFLRNSMATNGWTEGPITVVAIDPAQNGGKKYMVKKGNHRFFAATEAGLTEIPCIIQGEMNEWQARKGEFDSNIQKGVSRLEKILFVGEAVDIRKKGNKELTYLFSGDDAAKSSQVSSALAFYRRCPDWLLASIKAGKIAVTEAEKLVKTHIKKTGGTIPDEIKAEIEARTAESGSWRSLKTPKALTPEEVAAQALAIEKRAEELAAQKLAQAEEKALAEQKKRDAQAESDKALIAQTEAEKTAQAEMVKEVADFLAMDCEGESEADLEAFEALQTTEELRLTEKYGDKFKAEATRQLEARTKGAQEGSVIPPTTPASLASEFNAAGAKEPTPGEVESAPAKPLTDEQRAAILAQPSINESITSKTQNNPANDAHGKSIRLKTLHARVSALSVALAKLIPANEVGAVSEFADKHCLVGADGHAYVRVSLGHPTVRFLVDLGSDMVN